MKNLIFITTIIFGTNTIALAQWVKSGVSVGKRPIIDAEFHDSSLVCVLDQVSFYISFYKGNTYNKKSIQYSNKVQILNDSTYIAVRSVSYLWYTNNYGDTWSNLYLKNTFGDTINNSSILLSYFYPNGKAVTLAVGSSSDSCPNVFVSDNIGISWSKVNCSSIPIKASTNVSFMAQKVYIFGSKLFRGSHYSFDKLLIVSDYGNSIKETNWDTLEPGKVIYDYAFKDSLNGIIIFGEKMYKTTDGAQSVSQLFSPPPVFCGNISYAKPVDSTSQAFYMAAGSSGAYISKNDGQSWSKLGDEDYNYIGFGNSKFGIASVSFSVPEWYYFVGLPMGVPNEIADKRIDKIYPNPASNLLHIETTIANPSFVISTILGQPVTNLSYLRNLSGSYTFDITNLADGNYFLSISDGERKYFKKFIVSSK